MSTTVVTEMINYLTASLTNMATAVGGSLQTFASSMFLDSTGTTPVLSVFGALICAFAGISLAVGIGRLIFGWVSSLGARN